MVCAAFWHEYCTPARGMFLEELYPKIEAARTPCTLHTDSRVLRGSLSGADMFPQWTER